MREWLGTHDQLPGVWRGEKVRRAYKNRRPGLALRIDSARHQERQLGEELTMLLGHVVANHTRPGFGKPRARARSFLQGEFPFVEGRRRHSDTHAASPTGVLIIGTNPGSASTRASQVRSFG